MGATVGKERPLTTITTPFSCRHRAGQGGQIYVRTIGGLAAETPLKLNTGRIAEDRIVLRL